MGEDRLKKNDITKLYWENPADFADLFNAVYFEGREVLRPEELSEQDSNLPLMETGEVHPSTTDQTRDLLKLANHTWSRGAFLLLVGFENQTEVHYAMPLRIMGYEYRNYRRQYEGKARRHKEEGYKGMDSSEMLSRMRKTDRFTPVVTVVLYYGTKPWDGPKNLHEMLDIPEEMRTHVANYPMNLIEIRDAGLPVHSKRNQDFFALTRILLDSSLSMQERRRRAVQYEDENDVDLLVMITASVMFAGSEIQIKKRQEGRAMLEIFEQVKEEGREEGLQAGKTKIAKALLDVMDISTIAKKTGLTEEEVRALAVECEPV